MRERTGPLRAALHWCCTVPIFLCLPCCAAVGGAAALLRARGALPWRRKCMPCKLLHGPARPLLPLPLGRYAYPVTCTGFTKDASGRVTEVQVRPCCAWPLVLQPYAGVARATQPACTGATRCSCSRDWHMWRSHVRLATLARVAVRAHHVHPCRWLLQATYDPDFASKKPPKGVLNW